MEGSSPNLGPGPSSLYCRHYPELPHDVREQEGRGGVRDAADRQAVPSRLVRPRLHRCTPVRPPLRQRALKTGESPKLMIMLAN